MLSSPSIPTRPDRAFSPISLVFSRRTSYLGCVVWTVWTFLDNFSYNLHDLVVILCTRFELNESREIKRLQETRTTPARRSLTRGYRISCLKNESVLYPGRQLPKASARGDQIPTRLRVKPPLHPTVLSRDRIPFFDYHFERVRKTRKSKHHVVKILHFFSTGGWYLYYRRPEHAQSPQLGPRVYLQAIGTEKHTSDTRRCSPRLPASIRRSVPGLVQRLILSTSQFSLASARQLDMHFGR